MTTLSKAKTEVKTVVNRKTPRLEVFLTVERYATIVGFLAVVLILGVLTFIIKPPKMMALDNRFRAQLPKIECTWQAIADSPHKLEQYYNDRFAFRNEIISLRNLLTYATLGYTGDPEIIVGPDQWLEYRGFNNLESFLNRSPYNPETLKAVAQEIEDRRKWLAKRNIRFLLVLVPNKSSIYPGDMPLYYKAKSGETRTEQLLKYLQKNTSVETIYPRSELRKAAFSKLVYSKTDTHWNQYGGYIGYKAITSKLHSWFPSISNIKNPRFCDSAFCGELVKHCGLQPYWQEKAPVWIPSKTAPERWHRSYNNLPDMTKAIQNHEVQVVWATEVSDARLPSAIVLHDSFFNPEIQPFLMNNFRRSLNIWILPTAVFPMSIIIKEKPDVVIEEIVERHLLYNSPIPTPGLHQSLLTSN